MLDKLHADSWARWLFSALYIFLVWSLPCLAPHCTDKFMCYAVWPRVIEIADRSTKDPTALFTIILAASTIGLWRQTKRLAFGAEVQAGDIKGQLDILREDFTSTHRPWIGFEASIGPRGLWFADGRIHFELVFNCTNKGSTPAVGVSLNADATLAPITNELSFLTETCDALSAHGDFTGASGITIFPDGKWQFTQEFVVAKKDVDARVATARPIIPAVAGCIDYAFTFGGPEAHQTRFVYYIRKLNDDGTTSGVVVADGPRNKNQLKMLISTRMGAHLVN